MLDVVQIGPIIDYLQHERFAPRRFAGDHEDSGPAQPNLTMKDRTAVALLRSMKHWHRKLAKDNTVQLSQWKPSGIDPLEFVEGSREGDNLKCWTIRELLSSKALFAEGRQLKHCVASYASSRANGRSSIWTMEVQSDQGLTKLLTIEVQTRGWTICQVRGKVNRMATEKERSILQRWATKSELRIASYA